MWNFEDFFSLTLACCYYRLCIAVLVLDFACCCSASLFIWFGALGSNVFLRCVVLRMRFLTRASEQNCTHHDF